ncbi:hypothetical protein JTB14_029683 [Gonioctena quinquepunctata]|nr:hypothetical protein JTB14_029683 [Gonioctena quinquepunctata]
MLEKIGDDHINVDLVLSVIVSTVLWRACYGATRYSLPKKNHEYCSRIIALIHGLVAVVLGCGQYISIDSPFEHLESPNSYVHNFTLVTSLGYFIHDLVWCLQYQAEDKMMVAHHIYSVCAMSRILFKGYSGALATCALGFMELTNPFLQARWFIRAEGMYPSRLYTVMELIFIIVFTAVRILFGTYYLIISLIYSRGEWDIIMIILTSYLVSWLFFIDIVKFVSGKYFSFRKYDVFHVQDDNRA